ncbi:MAG: pantetheine-phosphate adenylyltransferase, partial [Clostridia bacterium]
LYVLVLGNLYKRPISSCEQRAQWIRKCLGTRENVIVEIGDGLLLDHVRRVGASAIVRGLRDAGDYTKEKPVADAFLHLYGVETIFL